MSSQLFIALFTLSIHPSAHKQLSRHLSNPFREFPCISQVCPHSVIEDGIRIYVCILIEYPLLGGIYMFFFISFAFC